MWAIVILVFVFLVRSVDPEGCPVFIKMDALLISTELVLKMFVCLENLVTRREVTLSAEVLPIENVEFLRVLCVKNVTGLDAVIEYDVRIIVPALNFIFVVSVPFFVSAVLMLRAQSCFAVHRDGRW